MRQSALVNDPTPPCFERLAPQAVRHTSGYRVQIGDRYSVEYLEGDEVASIAADLEGPVVVLHRDSVRWTKPHEHPATEDERTMLVDRVRAGIEAMGDTCEVRV